MSRTSEDEKRKVMLRTTADVMLNSLKQLECCAEEWPEYAREAKAMRTLCDGLIAHAREVGYVGRGRNG